MKELKDQKLAALALLKPGIVDVFEKYKLDFCCRGKRTLEEACTQQGVELEVVLEELGTELKKNGQSKIDFGKLSPIELCNYIKAAHHTYVRQKLPGITAHTEKVALRHGDMYPELEVIAEKWKLVAEDLIAHMLKEEHILFPFVEKVQKCFDAGESFQLPEEEFISNPIREMENEHEHAGDLMAEIRELTSDYTPPEEACTTWRLLFSELKEFEEDLHRHVHLENFLLFPKALEMERAVFKSQKAVQN